MEPSQTGRFISFAVAGAVGAMFGGFLGLRAGAAASFSRGAIGILPLSLVLTAGLIVAAVALTGLYVLIANRRAR